MAYGAAADILGQPDEARDGREEDHGAQEVLHVLSGPDRRLRHEEQRDVEQPDLRPHQRN
jgi:hypothetical protein